MKLVLLFFCVILSIILGLALLIVLSTIRLNVKKCNISNMTGNLKTGKINKEFLIYVEFYLLGIIKIAKIKITKKLLKKFIIKNELESIEKDIKVVKSFDLIKIIKTLKINVEKAKIYLAFGTDIFMLTVYLVPVISSILGIALRNANPNKTEFTVIPLYNFGNSIKFNLNCIIKVKIVHIIYVIYILLKKRRSHNERTSNRRAYDYSYE